MDPEITQTEQKTNTCLDNSRPQAGASLCCASWNRTAARRVSVPSPKSVVYATLLNADLQYIDSHIGRTRKFFLVTVSSSL